MFQPELKEPIKTLDLPLGGQASPIGALNLLMDFIEIAASEKDKPKEQWAINTDDEDGLKTVDALKKCMRVMKRVTGNEPGSMGLHPAVYFYNHRGKHSDYLFLAVVSLFSEALQNNDTLFFKKFSNCRHTLEEFLVRNKAVINQSIIQIGSSSRVNRLKIMFKELITSFTNKEDINVEKLLSILKLEGKLVAAELQNATKAFTKESKSAIYLKQSLDNAVSCPICNGYIDSTRSLSYDHIERVREGGTGTIENGQITHPYCNSAIKN
ncbi:HNH endonuclease [Kiloniella sp.]|uniref:HNH endonuclease n=1 Tax=Kiloniella sp. TaxID=1938587 RepID=UPI003B0265CE